MHTAQTVLVFLPVISSFVFFFNFTRPLFDSHLSKRIRAHPHTNILLMKIDLFFHFKTIKYYNQKLCTMHIAQCTQTFIHIHLKLIFFHSNMLCYVRIMHSFILLAMYNKRHSFCIRLILVRRKMVQVF